MAIEDRYRHTVTIVRMLPTRGGAAETGGGLDTTLTADSAVGALELELVDVGALAPGDFLRIGDAGEAEVREVAGVALLVVTLAAPLQASHDAGDQARQVDDAGSVSVDEYGQPVVGETTVATIRGLIQPRSAKEVQFSTGAGPVIGNHVLYCGLVAGLTTDCWIDFGTRKFEVLSIADAAGLGHHLEVALQEIK
jgi:hypothetical protein